MGRLFGTDGVRGVANSELTCEMAMNIGRAAAMVLTNEDRRHPRVLIGKDTRKSSDMLEAAITAGLCSVGANVIQLGVVPTPAVAYLVGKYKADAGVVLTASHNPCEFNGIKIIGNSNLAAQIPHSASKLYANNLYNFLAPMYQKETQQFVFNFADELVAKTCICKEGEIR